MNRRSYVPESHPRAWSLKVREQLAEHFRSGVVVPEGLIAHGRGEAFDYLIGEETIPPAREAVYAAAAMLLLAQHPVISVNGNVAALVAKDVVRLAEAVDAKIEVNLFHRTHEREVKISRILAEAGAKEVLGVGASATIPELESERRRVDPEGIGRGDVILIPLEDGDRAEALVRLGRKVIAIDLNPLSRTSRYASITIVDNVVRAMPLLVEAAQTLKQKSVEELQHTLEGYDNHRNLNLCLKWMIQRLTHLTQQTRTVA